MQLIEQSVDVWGECPTDILEAKRWIERAGRVCYNSEMGEDPNVFLDKVMSFDPPHSAMFEHSNLCLIPNSDVDDYDLAELERARWLNVKDIRFTYADGRNLIGPTVFGNFRSWMEFLQVRSIGSMLDELSTSFTWWDRTVPLCRGSRRVTVQLITDRNVLAEITRHRDDVGFCVQSQRYVDLSKEIEFIKPSWYDEADFIPQETFIHSCEQAELNYKTLRKSLPPQHARVALTGQCKTVIVMSAYLPEWDWIFKLRRAPGAYPQMKALMDMVYAQFEERGYIENN